MLLNFWYVAARSEEVGERPLKAKMLGQDFVVFRGKDGKLACLSDICIHRGASLSEGQVQQGEVECPYHGWTFNPEGNCTRIPSLANDTNVPKRARVDSYPVQEKFGWVWVFLGDLPASERPPLPDFFPEYEDTDTWRCIHGDFEWDANWTRVVENGIDQAHIHFVHPSFGNRDEPVVERYQVEEFPFGAKASAEQKPRPKKGLFRLRLKEDRPNIRTKLWVHMSGPMTRLDLQMNEKMAMIIVGSHLPVDENTTHTRWIMARNFFKQKIFDKDSIKRNLKVFGEDATIIHKVKPVHVPDSLADELTVESDGLGFSFRKLHREYAKLGWEIDSEEVDRLTKNREARVIPSPARAADPKGWVLDPVPTRPVPQMMAEAAE